MQITLTNPTGSQNSTSQAPGRRGNRRRFVLWVKAFGFSKLARELNTNRNTVHVWAKGRDGRCIAPANAFMSRIVDLSMEQPFEYGPITYDDMLADTQGFRGQRGTGYRTVRQAAMEGRR